MRLNGLFSRKILCQDSTVAHWAIIIVVTYVLVSLLPKPSWLCRDSQTSAAWDDPDIPDYIDDTPYKWRLISEHFAAPKNYYIDSANSYVLSMFPLYKGEQRVQELKQHSVSDTEYSDDKPRINEFLLENVNFTSLDRSWSNNPDSDSAITISHSRETQPVKLPLPECVYLKVPEEVPPAKICIHSGNVDNLISNNIRETGSWEEDHIAQMRNFFQVIYEDK